ncbi:hypothetical protein VF21_00297 [Pseudogymnoascus sp. 05NY08]|nr:hypothetical protein VF21_00297 [Pseudogymnoascus sp. 05NY08]
MGTEVIDDAGYPHYYYDRTGKPRADDEVTSYKYSTTHTLLAPFETTGWQAAGVIGLPDFEL